MEDDLYSTDVGPLMCKLYKKQLYTDVMFFSRNSKTSLFAHRAVMAAKSDYFANLLFGDQKSSVLGMQMQVEITHTPFSVFSDIVNYCYTGDIELTDDHTVLEIYAAAMVFQIVQLIDQCKIYIESMGLTEDNVCSILQICISKQIEELKERCLTYIQKNASDVIRSTDFEKCSFSTVREIGDLQDLNLSSEGELLDAFLRWVNVQPKHTKKELMKALLKCIRFLSFSPKQFSDFMQKNSEIMPAEEGLKILMYLNNPTSEFFESLPKWCNKTSRTLKTDVKNAFKDALENSHEECKVEIYLKPTKEKHTSELTSIVHMKCIRGKHDIKAIRFSFEEISNHLHNLAYLVINVSIFPGVFHFCKNYTIKRGETTYYFTKPVSLSTNKVIQIEVLAKIREEACGFLQFQRWHNDRRDFEIHVSSKPSKGNLNFISEILYSPHQN